MIDEFLLSPQFRVHSGSILETFRNSKGENQETNDDRSQNDPHLDVGVFLSQSSQKLSPDETYYSKDLVFDFEFEALFCKSSDSFDA